MNEPGSSGPSTGLRIFLVTVGVWAALIVPLRIVGQGFLPRDDAKRHAAHVVSGKSWCETTLQRGDCRVDIHAGWHSMLRGFQALGISTPRGLVKVSVVVSMTLFLVPALLLARWPEAWLASLCGLALFEPAGYYRIALGRPFSVTIAVLVALGWLWRPLAGRSLPLRRIVLLVALVALATWMHGSPYLWALPVLCFFLAAGPRVGLRMAAVVGLGTVLGALANPHPFGLLRKSVLHPIEAFLGGAPARLLVPEFQPVSASAMVVALVGIYLLLGRSRRETVESPLAEPFFVLAVTGWALGFLIGRFWIDWGLPALCVWCAQEIERALDGRHEARNARVRVRWTVALATMLVLTTTVDRDGHWTHSIGERYLDASQAETAGWLPGKGGILYNDNMKTYFDTFFANPRGDWKYVLAFEPGIMPEEDERTFRRIQNSPSAESYRPWVEKMRPEDRLVLLRAGPDQLDFPQLEWKHFGTGHWIGRLRTDG